MDINTNNCIIGLFIVVITFVPLVESRSCTYLSASGNLRTFMCSNYEYCCGNSCCRPAVITFYQLWYFWLSVIMIMLLCSGGSWWYRFKYRNQFLSPAGRFVPASGPVFRHSHHQTRGHTTIGVFYYPGNERVYLQNTPKDPNSVYNYMGGIVAPPPYTATAIYNPTSPEHQHQLQTPTSMIAMSMTPHHQAPPPSYESVVASGGQHDTTGPTPTPTVQYPEHSSTILINRNHTSGQPLS